jgi:hypothetical protein
MTASLLPASFTDLEPFATAWCLPTEPERWAQRLASTMVEMQAFYDACFPRAEEAIAYCDGFELHDMPADVERLMQMLCSLALVSYAIEVWQQPLPVHTGSARIDRTREPSP